ncbi:MAG: hypothetical protein JWO73_88 [Candidatus Taylorbacteria bacterium]|nr:hypothetical protein [Candidatus Taylorbacteria bacterium]
MNLVNKYSWLVDSELKKVELNIKEHPAHLDMNIESLPKLISLVNVIGYLRGQNNAFIEIRPHDVIEYQPELYKNEDAFESRLHAIITTICVDPKNLALCKSTLERHFIEYRLKK